MRKKRTSCTLCDKTSNIVTAECVFFEREDDVDDNVDDDDGITTKKKIVCSYFLLRQIQVEVHTVFGCFTFSSSYFCFLLLLPPALAIPNLDAKFCHSWFLDWIFRLYSSLDLISTATIVKYQYIYYYDRYINFCDVVKLRTQCLIQCTHSSKDKVTYFLLCNFVPMIFRTSCSIPTAQVIFTYICHIRCVQTPEIHLKVILCVWVCVCDT